MTNVPRIRATALSRADLLWAMADGQSSSVDIIAAQLRLRKLDKSQGEETDVRSLGGSTGPRSTRAVAGDRGTDRPDSSGYPSRIVSASLWLPTRFRLRKEVRSDDPQSHQPGTQILARDLASRQDGEEVTVVGVVEEVMAATGTMDVPHEMRDCRLLRLSDPSADVVCLIPANGPDSSGFEFVSGQLLLVDGTTRHVSGKQAVIARRVLSREQLRETGDERLHSLGYWHWSNPPAEIPQTRLLATWPVLKPRMSRLLSAREDGARVDEVKLVRKVARGELVRRIPRRRKRAWTGRVCVVIDENAHLIPYFEDQRHVVKELTRLLSKNSVDVLFGFGPRPLRRRVVSHGCIRYELQQPEPGSRIVVLGDLGCLAQGDRAVARWLQWGRRQRAAGSHLLGLFPGSLQLVHSSLRQVFQLESWQQNRAACIVDAAQRKSVVSRLLDLTGPTLRLEPGLLRDLRHLLPQATAASLEAEVWQSPLLRLDSPSVSTVNRVVAREKLQPNFERLPEHLRSRVLHCMRRWRKLLAHAPEVWFEEILNLSAASRNLVPASDREDAIANWFTFDQLLAADDTSSIRDFAMRFTVRAGDHALGDEQIGRIVRRLRTRFFPELPVHTSADPNESDPDGDDREISLLVADHAVTVSVKQPDTVLLQQCAVSVHSSNSLVEIAEWSFWKTGKPEFVSDYGTDRCGAWFEFQVPRADRDGVVTQRMRWVPAGTFLMGSPEQELHHESSETQHEVTLTRGFWLAETACTQELWQAVMGANPGHFHGPARPVENVSHNDVAKFQQALAELVPELDPALPTEAQWEYACRAGTTTPFSFGDTIHTDQVNYHGHYPYGDSPQGVYRKETVGVQDLPANPWGLYQMHGNVWEWCSDWYEKYSAESQSDPVGPERGSNRVVRGGSWCLNARSVRSACRRWDVPGSRGHDLGFRILSSASAEPTEAAEVPVAEQGPQQTRVGEADQIFRGQTIRVDHEDAEQVEISTSGPIRVRSNLEEILVQRTPKPDWAVEFGQDPFGTYADFQLPSADESEPVRQRMRWIRPGHFQMGSPDTEPGRYEDETPHSVTISSGFWMFDTPCPQRLWTAIRPGNNPSRFVHPDRPVECVNWEQAVEFAAELSEVVGLKFDLPTEAQWEYACRAGTSDALYSGPLEIIGDGNAPALDDIAWYGGNCGHRFDLDRGERIEWLKNKQYDFEFGGTRQVKQKKQNPWGLFDMLGNVWEWCSDWHGDYAPESQVDPVGTEAGSDRVVRGGSWNGFARYVRSACRHWCDPGLRGNFLGFRLLSSAGLPNK